MAPSTLAVIIATCGSHSAARGIASGLATSSVRLHFVTSPGAARLMHNQPRGKTPHAVEA